MERLLAFATALVLALVTGAVPPTPAAAASATEVTVTLREMSVELSTASVPAGPVVFTITNAGTAVHELIVLKTDVAPDAVPARTTDASRAQEPGAIAEAEDIEPGATATLSLTLTPGSYVLLCNEPGHYAAGMRAAFVVATAPAVSLSEMSIGLSTAVARSGAVTFEITNAGTVTHELIVLKTDIAEHSIPARTTDPTRVQEPGAIDEAEDIEPGATATLSLTLAAGKYVLLCNEPGHYAAHMHTSFTVLPTLSSSVGAAIDLALAGRGVGGEERDAMVRPAALLDAPGVVPSDADRAAIAAGLIPRAVVADGSLLY